MTTEPGQVTTYQIWEISKNSPDERYNLGFNNTKLHTLGSQAKYSQVRLNLTRDELLDLQDAVAAALADDEPHQGYVAHELPDGTWACAWGGMWLAGVYGKTAVEAIDLGRAEVAKG